jgi:hypothetical protein
MVTLSYLCGYVGYREVARFCKSQAALFTEALALKHPIPSHVTFREVLMRIDEGQLIAAFHQWVAETVPLQAGDWLSGDGKSLNSTVIESQSSKQDFQFVVSLFSQSSGLVVQVATFRNEKKSEIEVLSNLLTTLQCKGLIIRLDALHTQKKQ